MTAFLPGRMFRRFTRSCTTPAVYMPASRGPGMDSIPRVRSRQPVDRTTALADSFSIPSRLTAVMTLSAVISVTMQPVRNSMPDSTASLIPLAAYSGQLAAIPPKAEAVMDTLIQYPAQGVVTLQQQDPLRPIFPGGRRGGQTRRPSAYHDHVPRLHHFTSPANISLPFSR